MQAVTNHRISYMMDSMNTAHFLNSVGKRIRALRNEREWSQTELAKMLEGYGEAVTPSYISQIEGIGKIPSTSVLVALARCLETTTDFILMLTDDPQRPSDAENINYISPEADEMAQVMDSMPADMRQFVMSMTRQYIAYQSRRNVDEWRDVLAMVESSVGADARRRIESLLLARGTLPIDRKAGN